MITKPLSLAMQKQLHQKAILARKNAHAPYSGYKVGASILFDDGTVTQGCNIENASYGGTVCAERVAIWSGLTSGKKKIRAVCVVTDSLQPWPPCGFCRQVIAEFQTPQTEVLLANTKKICAIKRFAEIFPDSFSPAHLKK